MAVAAAGEALTGAVACWPGGWVRLPSVGLRWEERDEEEEGDAMVPVVMGEEEEGKEKRTEEVSVVVPPPKISLGRARARRAVSPVGVTDKVEEEEEAATAASERLPPRFPLVLVLLLLLLMAPIPVLDNKYSWSPLFHISTDSPSSSSSSSPFPPSPSPPTGEGDDDGGIKSPGGGTVREAGKDEETGCAAVTGEAGRG